MAYRRKQVTRSATFVVDHRSSLREQTDDSDSSTSSLAAQAIRASAVHRDSSLSSAYADPAFAADRQKLQSPDSDNSYEYTSLKFLNEPNKNKLWGVLAKKAKSILEENGGPKKNEEQSQTIDSSGRCQSAQSRWSYDRYRKDLGGRIRNALEEGLTMVENRTADIIQETKKLQIRRKNPDLNEGPVQLNQTDQETQLKASRDVANAMAAKAKLLLRELKTVKADLAFAKLRCSQLEEENKILREGREKGNEDDDLIRLQLETLLAEKARLAHENSVYARENRFLREIVEFHQFNTQEVVSLDEDFEEDNDGFALKIHPHFEEEDDHIESSSSPVNGDSVVEPDIGVVERETNDLPSPVSPVIAETPEERTPAVPRT